MKVYRSTSGQHYERVINFEMLHNYAHYVNYYCYEEIFGPEFRRVKLHFKAE